MFNIANLGFGLVVADSRIGYDPLDELDSGCPYMSVDWKTRITVDPAVLAGKPTIRGLRISVEQVLQALGAGVPPEELLADYPDLEPDDLQACIMYAQT